MKHVQRLVAGAVATALLAGGGSRSGAEPVPTCLEQTPTIVGTPGDDALRGTAARDIVFGGAGNDTIEGLGGNDLVCGGEGNDTLVGGAGNDVLVGSLGDDRHDGGPGLDYAVFFDSTTGVTVSLPAGTASGGSGSDSLVAVEGVAGSEHQDRLVGDAAPNDLDGLGGDDALSGGAGNDLLSGDSGNDAISGGPGFDTVYYDFSPNGVKVDLVNGRATGHGSDRLAGIEDVDGSRFPDVIIGNGVDNWLRGFAGNDRISGAAGNDRLDGGNGNDRLDGGPGRDRLDGGRGRDVLDGGPGRDVCRGERRRNCE